MSIIADSPVPGVLAEPISTTQVGFIAWRMESENPQWVVHFNCQWQEFVAIPARVNPARMILADREPGKMVRRMRRVELLARTGRALRKI